MNKAFVREPDGTAEYCPRCGNLGQPVTWDTLRTHLAAADRQRLSQSANFCPAPQCEVAYFDCFDRVVLASELVHPIYPKAPDAPLCACFGLTSEDIEQDVREGVTTRTKAALAKAASPAARCTELAANGRPCIAWVQKYFLQCRQRNATGGRST
jgi:bacterioferritin-associated ferredoxin